MNILDQIASVDEMAERFNVTTRTIRNWCENGTLQAKKMNKEWVIVKEQTVSVTSQDVKIKGIKKAVGEFNNWDSAARIYFDKENLEVTTYVYADSNSWQEYNDTSVVEVISKGSFDDKKLTMRQLEDLCLAAL